MMFGAMKYSLQKLAKIIDNRLTYTVWGERELYDYDRVPGLQEN